MARTGTFLMMRRPVSRMEASSNVLLMVLSNRRALVLIEPTILSSWAMVSGRWLFTRVEASPMIPCSGVLSSCAVMEMSRSRAVTS